MIRAVAEGRHGYCTRWRRDPRPVHQRRRL